MSKSSHGFVHLVLPFIVVLLIGLLFVPIPQNNPKGDTYCLSLDCPKPGWSLGPSLFHKIQDRSADGTPEETTSAPENIQSWSVYRNDEFGFELKFPLANTWKGMEVGKSTVGIDQNIENVVFSVPFENNSFEKVEPWFSPFYIQVIPSNEWKSDRLKDHIGLVGTKNDYHFIAIRQIDYPTELERVDFGIDQILSTFEFVDNKIIVKQEPPVKLDVICTTDPDCQNILSYNNCDMYCVNKNPSNQTAIDSIKRTCDAAFWDPPLSLNCGCIENNCHLYE